MKRLMTLWLLLIAMAGYGQSADVKMKTYVDGLMKKDCQWTGGWIIWCDWRGKDQTGPGISHVTQPFKNPFTLWVGCDSWI